MERRRTASEEDPNRFFLDAISTDLTVPTMYMDHAWLLGQRVRRAGHCRVSRHLYPISKRRRNYISPEDFLTVDLFGWNVSLLECFP